MDLNDTTNRIIAGIIIALVFVAGWWLIARSAIKPSPSQQATTTQQTSSTTTDTQNSNSTGTSGPSMQASGESVMVSDQAAGMSVRVESVTLNKLGWVAIGEGTKRVLGAARLDAGTHTAIDVPLLRGTAAGVTYQALMYIDDGDRMFDMHKDTLVTNPDGSAAGAMFIAQ